MSRRPLSHLPGVLYLAIHRRIRPEPARPYSFDGLGLTRAEYDELLTPRDAYIPPAPAMKLSADWPTP